MTGVVDTRSNQLQALTVEQGHVVDRYIGIAMRNKWPLSKTVDMINESENVNREIFAPIVQKRAAKHGWTFAPEPVVKNKKAKKRHPKRYFSKAELAVIDGYIHDAVKGNYLIDDVVETVNHCGFDRIVDATYIRGRAITIGAKLRYE